MTDHPTRSPDSPDPRGNAAIEAIGRIQRAIHMKDREASDGTLVTAAVIVQEAREAIREFHNAPPRSPDSPDPLWDDIYGEDGTARLLPGPPEVMSEADRRIASIAPRSSDSVRTPDLDVPERLCPHGTRWNYTCDECEKVVEWYAAVNDLYLVTHLHESDDCAECLAALHPASPPQENNNERAE
jgi:hypothetical protein